MIDTQGKLLVAPPNMPDWRFQKTVIYMWRHDVSGAAGVVVNKKWTNPFGIAHGGFLFSILDETLGSAACSVLEKDIYNNVTALSTTNHDIFFHAPARPNDTLTITAEVISCRKNMVFVEGHIHKDETLIAESKGIWFIKR